MYPLFRGSTVPIYMYMQSTQPECTLAIMICHGTGVSTNKSEGMSGGRGLGGACANIKVLSSTLFPHQSCISVEGLQSRHALCMLGRTLQ